MSQLSVSLVTTPSQLDTLLPEWIRLYYGSATLNPFAQPLWMTTWARHFIKPSQLYVAVARDAAGQLVGVAPFYRQHRALAPGLTVTSVQLLGTGQHVDLTELPQVLVQPGLERPVLRAVMHCLGERAGDWDWVEVVLTPQQGWFEPQWLPRAGRGGNTFVLHKSTRPCVVLSLPATWDEFRARLKRNVKESLRHGVNSLRREGHSWQVTSPSDAPSLKKAVDALVALHRARANVQGKVRHPDHLADGADRAFLHDVAGRMFAAGHLTPYVLHVNGQEAAARLVLHGNGATFFSCSGFNPQWWPYNVATTLMAECMKGAIARGDTFVNLSPGPDVAKLRWSENLHLHQEFIMVGGRRRSRLAFELFWQLRAANLIRRERARHEEA